MNFPVLSVQLVFKSFFFTGCAGFCVRRGRKICSKQENVMVKPSDWWWDQERGTEPEITFKSFQKCIDLQLTGSLLKEALI